MIKGDKADKGKHRKGKTANVKMRLMNHANRSS